MDIHVADAVGQSASASESKASAADEAWKAKKKPGPHPVVGEPWKAAGISKATWYRRNGGSATVAELNRELNRVCLKYSGERMFAEAIKRNPDVVLRFGRSYRKLLVCILAFEAGARLARLGKQ